MSLLVCDNPDAYVLKRAEKSQIDTFVFSPRNYKSKLEYEEEILKKLEEYQVDYLVLAGYMRLIGSTLLTAYANRIINIHPSLLPAFPGKDAILQAFEYGVKVTGVTVHFVDEGLDSGPIIYQEPVIVDDNDTYEAVEEKIHTLEHRIYPIIVQALVNKDFVLEGGKVKWVRRMG